MAQRDTLSASYEQIILSSEPNTVLYFDSGSGLNAFSSSLIYLTASNALTTSYILTADNANTASYSFYAKTASYATYAETSSYEATIEISSSWASASISASYADLAKSASYYPPFPAFPTAVPSASWVSSSAYIKNADTASYVASASFYPTFPTSVASASWVSASNLINSASYATTASYVPNLYPQTIQVSASWASQSLSASYVPNLYPQTVQVSCSWASQSLSSSWVPNLYPQTVQVSCSWASQSLSSSYASNVPLTASYALEALSASWAPDSDILYPASASWASSSVSASFASTVPQDLSFNSVTASYISASVMMIAPPPSYYYDVATKGYVDNLSGLTQNYYFRTGSSGISNYFTAKDLTTPLSSSTSVVTINAVSASQYFAAFITPAINTTIIKEGDVNVHYHAYYNAGAGRSATIAIELYLYRGGVETDIAADSAQLLGTGTTDSYNAIVTLTSSLAVLTTDQLLVKFKATSVTNTPNITIVVDGQTSAGFGFPVPSSNYVVKTGDTMTGNLTVPQVIGTASYVTTIGPQSAYQWAGSFYNDYGTSVTIASTDNGKVIEMTGSATQTITLATASIDLGWSATYYQSGSGKITFAAAGGSTLRSRTTFTSTAGQYALVTLMRVGNGDFVLVGDVGA